MEFFMGLFERHYIGDLSHSSIIRCVKYGFKIRDFMYTLL